jgi:hypothetical protein
VKPSQISKLGKAFVDSLNSRQVSDFLIWMLYHEVVELPEDPTRWFSRIEPIDMRGWIALGGFLAEFSTSMDTSYGFDIVVLDSICDRLELQRSTVHGLLKHFADPYNMAFSQIATMIRTNAEQQPEIEILEGVQSKLHEFARLACRLKPTEDSIYGSWLTILMKRLRGLLDLVVRPRINNIRTGAPLVTAATSEQLPAVVRDGIKLNYLFEVVQQKRRVPLGRYGVLPDAPALGLFTPPSSPPELLDGHAVDLSDAEFARNHAIQLMGENQNLRAQVASLLHDKEKLQEANDKLAQTVTVLEQTQAPSISIPIAEYKTATSSYNRAGDYLQVPKVSNRPRSLSHDAGKKLASELDQKNNASNHKRQRSEVLSWKYEDVFVALDNPLTPPIRLSDPATGKFMQPPMSPNTSSRVTTFTSGAGRRSGVVFSKDQMDLLKAIRGSTPSPPRDGMKEGEEEDLMATPTPATRKIFRSR